MDNTVAHMLVIRSHIRRATLYMCVSVQIYSERRSHMYLVPMMQLVVTVIVAAVRDRSQLTIKVKCKVLSPHEHILLVEALLHGILR
jgi:hypothetical protein